MEARTFGMGTIPASLIVLYSVVRRNDIWCALCTGQTSLAFILIEFIGNLSRCKASIDLFLYYINLLKPTGYVMH